MASSGNRVHLLNAEDEFLSAYWSSSARPSPPLCCATDNPTTCRCRNLCLQTTRFPAGTPQSLLALSTHEYVRRVHWNHVDVDVVRAKPL